MSAYIVRRGRPSPVMEALRQLEAQEAKAQRRAAKAPAPAGDPAPAKRPAAKKKPAKKARKA